MPFHDEAALGDMHIPYNWEYANSTAREAATGFTSADLGKQARQTDENSLWMLTATTPTWVEVGGEGESNTVSNIGTAGVGIYKQKVGVNFELKKLNAGSSKITVTDEEKLRNCIYQ